MKILRLNKRGDTIVEVLLAIAVLSFILSIAYGLANTSAQTNRQAQERAEAQKITEEQLELLRGFASVQNPWKPTYQCMVVVDENGDGIDDDADVTEDPTECTKGPEDRYQIFIDFDGTNTYTIQTRWNNIKGAVDQLNLSYKVSTTDEINSIPVSTGELRVRGRFDPIMGGCGGLGAFPVEVKVTNSSGTVVAASTYGPVTLPPGTYTVENLNPNLITPYGPNSGIGMGVCSGNPVTITISPGLTELVEFYYEGS